jgi:hypothetical protein
VESSGPSSNAARGHSRPKKSASMSSRTFSVREEKYLSKSKEAKNKYKENQVKRDFEFISDTFAAGTVEADALRKYIEELNYSGNLKNPVERSIREKHLEDYYLRCYNSTFGKRFRFNAPKWTMKAENHAIPKVYRTCGLLNPEEFPNHVEVDLPRNFYFSLGEKDWWSNLLIKSNLKIGVEYNWDILESDTQAFGFFPPTWDELDMLRYLYDMWPYAAVFARANWTQAILYSNRNPRSYLTGIGEVKPLEIPNAEHIHISSECIPFEYEGIQFVTNVERLYEVIKMYRRPKEAYAIGGSESHDAVLIHLIYSREQTDEDICRFLKSTKNYKDLFKVNIEERIQFEKEVQRRDESELDVYLYYASTSQREMIKEKLNLSAQTIENAVTAETFGMRTAWYRFGLTAGRRENLSEELENFNRNEDVILADASHKYGIEVKRTLTTLEVNSNELPELEDEPFGDLFGNFDNEDNSESNDSDTDDPFIVSIEEVLPSHRTREEDYLGDRRDTTRAATRTWDPGGSYV